MSRADDPAANAPTDVDDVLDPGVAHGPLAALLRPARATWDAVGVDAGLVAPGSARMTGAGLGLVAAFLAASVGLGLVAYVVAHRLASR